MGTRGACSEGELSSITRRLDRASIGTRVNSIACRLDHASIGSCINSITRRLDHVSIQLATHPDGLFGIDAELHHVL